MKKIMFNDTYALTAAVLNGSKTQTRRIVSDKLLSRYGHNKYNNRTDDLIRDAPFKVGEIVAVAQPYKAFYGDFKEPLRTELIDSAGFMNKMFVKAELMLHQIEITGIRVQRLQDISDEDCLAEGVIKYANDVYTYYNHGKWLFHADLDTPQKAYADLINRISGKGTWERNQWVFAYNFKLVK